MIKLAWSILYCTLIILLSLRVKKLIIWIIIRRWT